MNVESVLERKGTEVATIAPEANIKRAADWLRAKNIGALVVTSNDAILGIISERDIVRAFSQHGEALAYHASEGHHDARLDHRVPGQ
jgi:CBS domain-containing protein